MHRELLEVARRFEKAVIRRAKEQALAPIEKKMERFMAALFRKQGRLFLEQLNAYRGRFSESLSAGDASLITASVEVTTAEELRLGMQALLSGAMGKGGGNLIAQLGLEAAFDLNNPRAVNWISGHAAELVTQINSTTRDEIGRLVTQQVSEGWSYDKTAREIKGRFSEFAVGKPQQHIQSRAHLVAINEASMAYEQGNAEMARQMGDAGLRMEKSWLTVGDSNVSDGCQENEGAGWIPFDEAFPSGDEEPPRFPSCRCTALFRAAEEKAVSKQARVPVGDEWKAKVERAHKKDMRNSADLRGMSPEQLTKSIDDKLVELTSDATPCVRVDESVLNKILEEGRFKSQFESQSSGGYLRNDLRAKAENKFFGVDLDMPAQDRPIYGYLRKLDSKKGDLDTLDQYGDISCVLKPSARERTTFNIGDSLDGTKGATRASRAPVSLENPNNLAVASGPDIDAVLAAKDIAAVPPYAECQIWGQVKTTDIAEVLFGKVPPAATKTLMDQHGIAWRVVSWL